MTAELPLPCAEHTIHLALAEQRASDLLPCLRRCFEGFRHSISDRRMPLEALEDIFWEAALALHRKAQKQVLSLSVPLCAYFHGFVKNYRRNWQKRQARNPLANPLDDSDIELPDDDMPVETMLLDREKQVALMHCISLLDERNQTIIRNYFLEKTDSETAAELGIGNWRSIAVMRARCFEKLRQLLKKHYPDLLDFKF